MMNAADVVLDDETFLDDWYFTSPPFSDVLSFYAGHSMSPISLATVSPFDYLIRKPPGRTPANANAASSDLSSTIESPVFSKINVPLYSLTIEFDLLCEEPSVYEAQDTKECYPFGSNNAEPIGQHQTNRRHKAPKPCISCGQHYPIPPVDIRRQKKSLPLICAGSHQHSITVKRARSWQNVIIGRVSSYHSHRNQHNCLQWDP
ncbi:hypothetical protein FocTR4_00011819 [Fusarium oxysporum f. sp. cubense]|uniref:Uncharacterized protein n=1 Tax=Fusarium oxysporum f. sp. cubense TaxID=61366 RepID=A0A5C6SF76_FUSOC|nr:hypothetical protein FocTR4_00011819 [Fusarium oxysporum f. sp. cubense]